MFKYSVFFEFILKSCNSALYMLLFAILNVNKCEINKCGSFCFAMTLKNWQLQGFMCHCTPKLCDPHLFRSHSISKAKQKPHSSLGSCSASWYWIMNLKGNLEITKLTVFIIWNQTVPGHLDHIRIMLSTAMANVLSRPIYKLKEKKMKVFMRKTEQPCSVNKGASYRINAGHHRPVLSRWNSQLPPGCMVNRSGCRSPRQGHVQTHRWP